MSVDVAAYRNPQELEAALQTDPIARARAALLKGGTAAQALDAIENEAQAEVDAALAAADAAPWPQADAAFTDVQDTGAGQWI